MLNKKEKKMIIQESFKMFHKKARLHNIEISHQILQEFSGELSKFINCIDSYEDVKIIGNYLGFLISKYSSSENHKSA